MFVKVGCSGSESIAWENLGGPSAGIAKARPPPFWNGPPGAGNPDLAGSRCQIG